MGAGLGAFNRNVDPRTGEKEGFLGSMASGAVKGAVGGALLGKTVKSFNPAIQGTKSFGQNVGDLYHSAAGKFNSFKSSLSVPKPAAPTTPGVPPAST